MNKQNKYRQVPECLLEDMDGELLLYNPKNATTLHLNGPSAIVWGLCNGENTVAQMIDIVSEAYPDQAEQIAGDIVSVIKELSEQEALALASD